MLDRDAGTAINHTNCLAQSNRWEADIGTVVALNGLDVIQSVGLASGPACATVSPCLVKRLSCSKMNERSKDSVSNMATIDENGTENKTR